MPFLVEFTADTRLPNCRLYKTLKSAENAYFRAFAAVVQKQPIQTPDGSFVRLLSCTLFEVATTDRTIAMAMIRDNEARRLHSSDDPMCGPPIAMDLFQTLH